MKISIIEMYQIISSGNRGAGGGLVLTGPAQLDSLNKAKTSHTASQ